MKYTHIVQYYETDKMGITHHSNYIRWMEESRIDFLNQIGWPFSRIEQQGFFSPVIRVECKYVRPCTFADEITIYTWIKDYNAIRATFAYRMELPDGTVVCVGESTHCFVDLGGKPIRADEACPEFIADLLKYGAEEPAK